MGSNSSWPPSDELFSMVPTNNVTEDIFGTSPIDSVNTWDPDNNDWKTDADWHLFGSDVSTIDPLPQLALEGFPARAAPSSSLSSSNSSGAIATDCNAHFTSSAPLASTTMLPFRPSESMNSQAWGLPQSQPLSQQPFPGTSGNGLLIQLPESQHSSMMHSGGVGLGIFDDRPQLGPSMPWNDNAPAFDSQHSLEPALPKLECTSPTDADDEAGDAGDQSYAKLLYECLLNAPGHTLPLKDIYAWMQQSTSKARDPSSKGWQNSVRHNLSMNQGFEKVQSSAGHGSKKGGAGLWRLSEDALRKGAIISTTRYRKEPKKRHGRRPGGLPAPKRVASGAKGGRATRDGRDRQQRLQARSYHHSSTPGYHQPRSNPFYGSMPTPGQYSSTSAASSPMFEHLTMARPGLGGLFPQDHPSNSMMPMNVMPNTSTPVSGSSLALQIPQRPIDRTDCIPTPPPSSDYYTDYSNSPWITTSNVSPEPAEMHYFNGMGNGMFSSPNLGREQSGQA